MIIESIKKIDEAQSIVPRKVFDEMVSSASVKRFYWKYRSNDFKFDLYSVVLNNKTLDIVSIRVRFN